MASALQERQRARGVTTGTSHLSQHFGFGANDAQLQRRTCAAFFKVHSGDIASRIFSDSWGEGVLFLFFLLSHILSHARGLNSEKSA